MKGRFIWRVTASHVTAYSFAGIFALLVMNYTYLYSIPPLSCFMRPVDSPFVAIGPSLQIFRGMVISLILWFFRKNLLEGKYGFLKIFLLIFGLSYFSTIGPSMGSFEAFIYTTFPVEYNFIGLPETLIYVSLFSLILFFWYKFEKKLFTILSIVLTALLVITNILVLLNTLKII
jgi:hypothetical protein